MVFIHETHVMPSCGKVETKSHLFSYVVPVYTSANVLVAPNRNKLIHYVLWAGPGCTHFEAIYGLFMTHI